MKSPTVAIVAFVALAVFAGGALASGPVLPPKGKIYFGAKWVRVSGNLEIEGRKSTFHEKGKMAWVAHFTKAAGTHKLGIGLWKGGKEIWHGISSVRNVKINEFANKTQAKNFITLGAKLGTTYTLRYFRGHTVLASGPFKIVK